MTEKAIASPHDAVLGIVLRIMGRRAKHVVISNSGESEMPANPADIRVSYSGESTLLAYSAALDVMSEFSEKKYGSVDAIPDDAHADMKSKTIDGMSFVQVRIEGRLVCIITGIGRREWEICEKIYDATSGQKGPITHRIASEKLREVFPVEDDFKLAMSMMTTMAAGEVTAGKKYAVRASSNTVYAGDDPEEAKKIFVVLAAAAARESGQGLGMVNFRDVDGTFVATITDPDGKPIVGSNEMSLMLIGVSPEEFQTGSTYESVRPTVH